MAKLEVFQNGNFSNGDPVYQIGTKNSEGGYDAQVFDLMSEAEAKAKLKTISGKKAQKPVVEDPVETTLDELSRMTKLQLEEFAREFGVELDRREKKNELVNQAYEAQFDG